jgi:threonine/homoserine/homoserine lactone efflux protein
MCFTERMNLTGLFAIGFIMGLTGAMAPGPLLTVTISESTRRGGIVGPLVVLGHGILEAVLLVLIVFGVGSLLNNRLLFGFISFGGGLVLLYMATDIMRGLKHYSLDQGTDQGKKRLHPVWAGIVVSISNPYWFVWWLTIGMGYVIFAGGLGVKGVLAFFAGHILSDLAWYSFVSYGVQFGGKYVGARVLKGVLFVCSIFLVFFGIFFIIKGYQFIM